MNIGNLLRMAQWIRWHSPLDSEQVEMIYTKRDQVKRKLNKNDDITLRRLYRKRDLDIAFSWLIWKKNRTQITPTEINHCPTHYNIKI